MFTSRNESETQEFGRGLAAECGPGTVIALSGDLGAGKTQLVKGLARGLGCEREVTSPTFTLIHEYIGGRLPLYHFDLYRIEDANSLERLGIDEYFNGGGVSVVEWADKFHSQIPATARWIELRERGENEREIVVHLHA